MPSAKVLVRGLRPKAQVLERLHHAVSGGLRHIDQAMQLGESHFLMLLAKRQQQLQPAIQSGIRYLHACSSAISRSCAVRLPCGPQLNTKPPLTGSSWPVTKSASDDSR